MPLLRSRTKNRSEIANQVAEKPDAAMIGHYEQSHFVSEVVEDRHPKQRYSRRDIGDAREWNCDHRISEEARQQKGSPSSKTIKRWGRRGRKNQPTSDKQEIAANLSSRSSHITQQESGPPMLSSNNSVAQKRGDNRNQMLEALREKASEVNRDGKANVKLTDASVRGEPREPMDAPEEHRDDDGIIDDEEEGPWGFLPRSEDVAALTGAASDTVWNCVAGAMDDTNDDSIPVSSYRNRDQAGGIRKAQLKADGIDTKVTAESITSPCSEQLEEAPIYVEPKSGQMNSRCEEEINIPFQAAGPDNRITERNENQLGIDVEKQSNRGKKGKLKGWIRKMFRRKHREKQRCALPEAQEDGKVVTFEDRRADNIHETTKKPNYMIDPIVEQKRSSRKGRPEATLTADDSKQRLEPEGSKPEPESGIQLAAIQETSSHAEATHAFMAEMGALERVCCLFSSPEGIVGANDHKEVLKDPTMDVDYLLKGKSKNSLASNKSQILMASVAESETFQRRPPVLVADCAANTVVSEITMMDKDPPGFWR